ncbi:Fic family protein [Candidatus Pacearchaeota archaeon]|nr:Fic family protein [Candidatus Pacearchaeota archaeon]
MKLPDKPFDVKKLLDKNLGGFSKFIRNDKFRQLVSEYNKRYLYWSELKYRIKDKTKREYAWALMMLLRSDNYEKFNLNGIKMKYSLLPDFNKKLHLFDKNLAGNIQIKGESLNLKESYIISSLMEEAIASSQLEGAATTRKVAKAMLREKRKPRNNSEKMIFNNYETMRYILENKNEKLTPEFIIKVQNLVTKDTLDNSKDEGRFRDNDETIVSYDEIIAYVPPPYKEVELLINEFCDFANDSSKEFIHPIIKGIILHFLIGYIHPFNDGNGRTARSIFYWYMLSQGYWLFEYMAISKRILRSRKKYGLAYLHTEYDNLDLTYFIKYNLYAIEDSLKDMVEYIRQQQKEQRKTKEIIDKNPYLNLRQALILEEFMKNPLKTFTIKEIMETYGIAYQTARTDLLLLNKKEFIIKKISGQTFVYIHQTIK